ncbi:MAG TPA: DNA translocase FtsK [Chloroflexota bacterium]|nr:DNA translocase FtsK [Chloroflexota bacterium]
MAVRRESARAPRRPPAGKSRPSGGLGKALGGLWRAAWPRWPWALAVLLVGAGGVLGLALVFPGGRLATPLHDQQTLLLGWTAPLLALWLTVLGSALLLRCLQPEVALPWPRGVGAALASVALVGLGGIVTLVRPGARGGGQAGLALAQASADALGLAGAAVLLALVAFGGLLLALRVSPVRLLQVADRAAVAACFAGRVALRRLRALRAGPPALPAPLQAPEERQGIRQRIAARVRRQRASGDETGEEAPTIGDDDESESHKPAARASRKASAPTPQPPAPERGAWRLPPLTLLALPSSPSVAAVDLRQRARIIEETLESFNIGARVVEINEGPTVTQFGIEPAMGVTVARITARTNDLALRLGATTLRVEAPVPGKRVVGIEVPNSASAVVSLREIVAAPEFQKLKSRLALALGRDVAGRPVAGDLARMPHLLIAGATGSGKSVCINSLIACLLMQCTPDELQLLMVDPKMVELAPFEGIPHLRLPVVTEMDKVVGVLKWALQEMERRYALFVKCGVRNLESYNRLAAQQPTPPAPVLPREGEEEDAAAVAPPFLQREGGPGGVGPSPLKPLPFLVIVIDELADLMMTAPDDVELSLTRLAQKARATGIHLIVATQRPSVDVVTGLIKANFPTRIAFAVTSQVDSRVILDSMGAEKLLGRGDMLYLGAESSKPARVQGTYLSDEEIEALVAFWRKQGEARYDAAEVAAVEALSSSRDDGGEDLIERAMDVVREHSRVSVSLLQRRLGIGYPRAARLMDTLAERGLVEAGEDGRSWVAAADEPSLAEPL